MSIKKDTHLIIMAGGSGQRFWPWSTKKTPKQFQDFLSIGESLLQTTVKRFEKLISPKHIWVVTNINYTSIVEQQLPWLDPQHILSEPISKNTAACIVYACHEVYKIHPEATLIVSPSDHVIHRENIFLETIKQALQPHNSSSYLTLLGIPCGRAETGYGYIKFDKDYTGLIKPITGFREKPSLEDAENYTKQPDYVWNSGIFIGKLSVFIKNFKTYLPEIWNVFEKYNTPIKKEKNSLLLENLYQSLPAVSFDQGILEKARDVYVIICKDFGWTDLGTWNALYDHLEKDNFHNVCQGKVVSLATKNCLIKGNNQQLIATYAIKDLVIVSQHNTLLICPRSEVQNLKKFIEKLQQEDYEEFL